MDDVQTEFVLAAEGKKQANGKEFGGFGARLQIGLIDGPIRTRQTFRGGVDGTRSSA